MIELKGMTWDHPRGYQPLITCSEKYEAEFGVKVSWDKRSLKDFGDQPIDTLADEYDLLIIDHPHAGLAAATGCLLPLDDWLPVETLQTLAKQSAGLSHQSYVFEGHQWGLAIDAAMQTAVYRADLLHDERPHSWNELITLGKMLRQKEQFIAMPLVPTDAMCSFITLCASLGEPIGQDDMLVSLETGAQALAILREITQIAHPDSLNWNPIHLLDYMSNNDDVVYCPLTFCYTNYSRVGYQPKLLTFTTIPGIKGSILGGTGFAVSSRCKYPHVACVFGAWLCSAEIQRGLYTQSGGQPGNLVAWQDAEANTLTNDFFKNTLPTLESSLIRPRHDGFIPFQEEAGNIIHTFLKSDTNTESCLSDLSALYNENKQTA